MLYNYSINSQPKLGVFVHVTKSHADLVREQLANTDAQFVKVYSLGQTTVIFTGAATHEDVIILNKNRRVKQSEIDFVLT